VGGLFGVLRTQSSAGKYASLYGCDIDKNAFDSYLFPKYKLIDSSLKKRFLEKDFLALKLNDFSKSGFQSVIGNPPYISHHNMTPQRERLATFVLNLTSVRDKR